MGVALDRIDEQHEFVAADAREHVGLAHELRDAARDLHEQRVADGVIVVVVDVLEIVEIDERQREMRPLLPLARRMFSTCS